MFAESKHRNPDLYERVDEHGKRDLEIIRRLERGPG
jgi:hypothetical protein